MNTKAVVPPAFKALREFVKKHKPRPDWHEPDEQDIKAWVLGNHLDNAMGDNVVPELIKMGTHEFLIVLTCGVDTLTLNLSSILALAAQPVRNEE